MSQQSNITKMFIDVICSTHLFG